MYKYGVLLVDTDYQDLTIEKIDRAISEAVALSKNFIVDETL